MAHLIDWLPRVADHRPDETFGTWVTRTCAVMLYAYCALGFLAGLVLGFLLGGA